MSAKLIAILCVMIYLSGIGYGADLYVPEDYSTIQEAINEAASGDTIYVNIGTYYENLYIKDKVISLISLNGYQNTILDGMFVKNVLELDNAGQSVIEGFTITNGNARYYHKGGCGGGILVINSSPRIRHNCIQDNTAQSGTGKGGGIAVYGVGPVTIERNLIFNNLALGSSSDTAYGGGIYFRDIDKTGDAYALIVNNVIAWNTAEGYPEGSGGGGIQVNNFTVDLINNTFANNTAAIGGGMDVWYNSDMVCRNTQFWNNDSVADQGEEISMGGGSFLDIAYSNVAGGNAAPYIYIYSSSTLTWDYATMYNLNPLFVDSANLDYHIQNASPSRDCGDNGAATAAGLTQDFEGDARIVNSTVDIGADEYSAFITAILDIAPDSLKLKSNGNWITAYIELPEGYTAYEIEISSLMLNETVPAELWPTSIEDRDGNDLDELMVKFNRQAVQSILEVGKNVEIRVSGELDNGMEFQGVDYIKVH